jgi:hypothetical protein
MVAEHTKQLKNGFTPEQVKFSTSVPVLRDASVQPIVDLYNWAETAPGRELIQRVSLLVPCLVLANLTFDRLGENVLSANSILEPNA